MANHAPTSLKGCIKPEDRIKSYILQWHNLQLRSLTFFNNPTNRKRYQKKEGIASRNINKSRHSNPPKNPKQKPKFGLSKIAVLNFLLNQTVTTKKGSLKYVSRDCLNKNLLLSLTTEVILIPFILSPLNDEGLFFFFKIWPFFCNYNSKKLILHSFWSYHEVQ